MEQRHLDTVNTFRKLWGQHTAWTKATIISSIENLEDLNTVRTRLLRNPSDFAYELAPFYGEETAHQFTVLLRELIFITFDFLAGLETDNMMLMNEAKIKWYSTAERIASFLSSINPHWSKAEWQKLLFDYLKMIENVSMLRLSKKYVRDTSMYDQIESHTFKIADYMWQGIIAQFS